MTSFIKRNIIFIFCIAFLCSCTPSQDEAARDTQSTVTTIFKNKAKKANESTQQFTYYKPETLKITQKGEHNIILKDNEDNLFILFVNPKENNRSKVDYQAALKEKEKGDTLRRFQAGNTLLYILIKPEKDERKVELIISGGGVKMSTQTTLDKISAQAEMMAEIIHSVKVNKNGAA